MAVDGAFWLFAGAVGLGFVHGIEPGHGWPIAATYALDQSNKWLHGFAASFILGVGHLVSSIAMVLFFFWAKDYFGLTQIGWMNYVAGVLLIALGVREYFHGHSHGHAGDDHDHEDDYDHHDHAHEDGGVNVHDHRAHDHADDHDHSHSEHVHSHAHDDHHDHAHDDHDSHDHHHDHGDGESTGWFARLKGALPFVGGHSHAHASMDDADERGLLGIAGFAFVLGFAHEEEFEIIAICTGSQYCLELMLVYALTVIFGIVGLTLLLIAGYENYEETVEEYAEHLPTFSAVVLIIMGFGFLLGLF